MIFQSFFMSTTVQPFACAGGSAPRPGTASSEGTPVPRSRRGAREGILLAPDNPRYAYVYAIALDSAGKHDAALLVLGEAYRRHPYDREVLLGLASILRDRGRAKEATRYAEELVALMPESAEAKRLLEEIRSKGGR